MRLDPSLVGYSPAQTEQFYRVLTERAAAVPGVRRVGLTSSLPMVPGYSVAVAPEGFDFAPGQESVTIVSSSVDHGYFEALGVGIVSGRAFLQTDTVDSPWVAVVDQTFASRYLGSNPIGKRLRFVQMGGRTAEVVGITVMSRHNSIFSPPQPFLYLPVTQHPVPRMTLIAETEGDPAIMAGPLREIVRSIDVNVPVYRVETMEELFDQRSVAVANIFVGITTIVGLVGLCLALVGLYAIVSYQVSRRVREIGIRMAIGAVRAQVLGMILKHAAAMGMIGVAVGMAISFAGGRGLTAALNAPRFDPLLFGAVPFVLFATTTTGRPDPGAACVHDRSAAGIASGLTHCTCTSRRDCSTPLPSQGGAVPAAMPGIQEGFVVRSAMAMVTAAQALSAMPSCMTNQRVAGPPVHSSAATPSAVAQTERHDQHCCPPDNERLGVPPLRDQAGSQITVAVGHERHDRQRAETTRGCVSVMEVGEHVAGEFARNRRGYRRRSQRYTIVTLCLWRRRVLREPRGSTLRGGELRRRERVGLRASGDSGAGVRRVRFPGEAIPLREPARNPSIVELFRRGCRPPSETHRRCAPRCPA